MIYIFGANGMLGAYASSYLSKYHEIKKLTRYDYDLNNLSIETLEKLLINLNISDIVINCAGIIPQRDQDHGANIEMYFKINSLFPVMLSMICKNKNAKFIHITTDCVFSGKDGKYNENSNKDETNHYGVSKTLGELCYGMIIRTSIIGEEIENKKSLLEWVISKKNQEINGYDNHYWNGVTCLQLVKIINKIIIDNIFWNGIRHIFSPNIVSKYELVNIINNIYGLNIKINKYNTNYIDKTLTTIYNTNDIFNIPELDKQILEMYNYNINTVS